MEKGQTLSGAQKRRRALEKKEKENESIKKIPKLSVFLSRPKPTVDTVTEDQDECPLTISDDVSNEFPSPCTSIQLSNFDDVESESSSVHVTDQQLVQITHEYWDIDRESMFLPVGTSDTLDPAKWLHINDCLIEEVVRNWKGDQHQLQCDFWKSACAYHEKTRLFSPDIYIRMLQNEKKANREWLESQLVFTVFHVSSFPALRHRLVIVDLMIGIIYLQH